MLRPNVSLYGKTVMVTGCAGFIGAALTYDLLSSGKNIHVIGIDSMDGYYDVSLKEYRLGLIYEQAGSTQTNRFTFIKGNIAEKGFVEKVFMEYAPRIVVNLAAQAGVRYSLINPVSYIESNIVGFFNILEACRNNSGNHSHDIEHLVFASSSSVYGDNKKIPYSTDDRTDQPVSLYAATKKADEILAYSYAKMYSIPMTGLRFFTVYGPAGRPDMAYFDFANKLILGEKIKVYNYGNCKRDFTYIDDVVAGIKTIMQCSPVGDAEAARYKVYNIGHHSPINLLEFIQVLCGELKRANLLDHSFDLKPYIQYVGKQPGDVEVTYADVSELERDFGFKPMTDLKQGLHEFARWYAGYYQ